MAIYSLHGRNDELCKDPILFKDFAQENIQTKGK